MKVDVWRISKKTNIEFSQKVPIILKKNGIVVEKIEFIKTFLRIKVVENK